APRGFAARTRSTSWARSSEPAAFPFAPCRAPTAIGWIRPSPVTSFVLRGLAWSLGLFGLIRLAWFEALVVLPLTQAQARLAASLFGAPMSPIDVTLACSGADALALCAGVILAYPAAWKLRM